MLFKELLKIISAIEFYDNKEGWRAFVEHVQQANIAALRDVRDFPTHDEKNKTLQWTKMALGAGWYTRLVKPLPVMMEIMGDIIREREGPAHARAALAAALAYLVQRDDIIPEAFNGGYGLLDDALILYYAYYKFLRGQASRVPQLQHTLDGYCRELEAIIKTGLPIFPTSKFDELRASLSNVAMGFYHLQEVPTYILEQIIEQIIQNPEQNAINQLLPRLAYHLDVRFPAHERCTHTDPVLGMVEAMAAEAGSSPGELTSEGYYY